MAPGKGTIAFAVVLLVTAINLQQEALQVFNYYTPVDLYRNETLVTPKLSSVNYSFEGRETSTTSNTVEDTKLSSSSSRPTTTTQDEVVRETTRLLYKDSPDLEKWLAAPLPKLYIYDTLSKNWSDVKTISQCVNDRFLNIPMPNGRPTLHLNWTDNCLWEPGICDDAQTPGMSLMEQKLMNYKSNYNNDVAFLEWFRGYSHVTTDPTNADIFLVPYPHKSHCLCHRDFRTVDSRTQLGSCPYGLEEVQPEVLDKLTYYKNFTKRHLFLLGPDWGQVRPTIRKVIRNSMSISLGPADGCKGKGSSNKLCGHLVTPYLSSGAAYQPTALLLDDRWQWTKREFSVGAVFGTPENFHLRVELMQNRSTHVGESVGGLPIKLVDLGRKRIQLTSKEITEVYHSSMFCPVLPGDGCAQKRLFDVILSGCIPVVPRFTPSDEKGYPTFFNWMKRCSIRRTYPFARGSFFDDPAAGIDYESLVVSFDGLCGIACMKPAIEVVMNNATEMKRLQDNMRRYAKLFAFGLDENMYQSVDAFSAMLVAMRHYVSKIRDAS